MRRYAINLSPFTVEDAEGKTLDYPITANLNLLLRIPGLFDNIQEVSEASKLAIALKHTERERYEVDEREYALLEKALNRQLEMGKQGRSTFGDPVHADMMIRIADAERLDVNNDEE